MAYDTQRDRIVVFGGSNGSTYFGDTLEWDGTSWSPRPSSGPAPRSGAAMAYDPVRSRVVLFGGGNNTTKYGDTWEWDGTAWSQRSSSGPAPRTGCAMAFDSMRGRLVLFGGSGASGYNDTWEWDGTAWTPKAGSGPPAGAAVMAYEGNGRVLLFSNNGNTWEWDGTAWTQRVASGPSPRQSAAMGYDSIRNRVVLFGGQTSNGSPPTFVGDTWEWNPAAGTWTQVSSSGPSPRAAAKMAYDVTISRMVLYGGSFSNGHGFNPIYGDTWKWDGTAWTTHPPNPPAGGASMAYEGNGRVLLFSDTGNTWEWDGTAWTQRVVSGPSPREGVAMAYDSVRNRVVLFGGQAFGSPYPPPIYADTWEWNPAAGSWTQVSASGPSARASNMAYDVTSGRMVLFGGVYFNAVNFTFYGDTWEWDGAASAWTQMASSGTPRYNHAMAYDPARGRVVLFGGDNGTYLGDTWEWDGTVWTQQSSSGPSPRASAAMAYDGLGRVMLFGGGSGALFSDTWEWNGAAWTQRTFPVQPTARSGHAMAYDAMRDRVVLFGGEGIDDTWEYNGCLPSTWYGDADGDGHGNGAVSVLACIQPTGYVAVGDDCDDTDAATYSNAPEVNDGHDNQCPDEPGYGVVDEVSGASIFSGSNFCWPPQSGATTYQVVRSPQPDFSTGCVEGTIVNSGNCVLDFNTPPPGGTFYYLVRALTPHVGSWGQDSSGNGRTGGCLPQ